MIPCSKQSSASRNTTRRIELVFKMSFSHHSICIYRMSPCILVLRIQLLAILRQENSKKQERRETSFQEERKERQRKSERVRKRIREECVWLIGKTTIAIWFFVFSRTLSKVDARPFILLHVVCACVIFIQDSSDDIS